MPLMLTPDIDREAPGNRTPPNGPERTAAQRNVRMFERVFPHRAPDTPRQGDTPARPARMPTYTSLSIASIQSVMNDEFGYLVWAPDLHVQMLPGEQAPATERANIDKPSAVAYGSLFTLVPNQPYVYE